MRLSGEAAYIGLEGSRTVAMRLAEAFIADAFVIAQPSKDFISTITLPMILAQAGLALGLIGACVAIVESEAKTGAATNRHDFPRVRRPTSGPSAGLRDGIVRVRHVHAARRG